VPLPWPVTGDRPIRGTPTGPQREAKPALPAEHNGSSPSARRVLVGAVGYRNLRDMSAGPLLLDRLRELAWPPGVEVEDLSFGAVHVLHWLQERPPYDHAVLVAAVARGRSPGSVEYRDWIAPPIPAEAVQERIAEAVTGVIGLDTLLIVLAYFEALPPRVTLIEIEPLEDDWGPDLSPPVAEAIDEALRLVQLSL